MLTNSEQHDDQQKPVTVRRQTAEHCRAGDGIRFSVDVHASIHAIEKAEVDSYLLSVRVESLETVSVQTLSGNRERETVDRVRPVLWASHPDGELELIIDVGARQRLQIIGPTARERAIVEQHLKSLAPEEAQALLEQLAARREDHASTNSLGNQNHSPGARR